MKGIYFILFFVLIASVSSAQESKLAQQYFKDGEYEKAAMLYKKLYEEKNYNDYYFKYYFNSLLNLGEYEEAEKAIKEAIKKRPDDTHLLVRQGGLLEDMQEKEEADKLYRKAVKKLKNDRTQIIRTANVFTELTKFDYALEVYEKGVDLTGDASLFASNLADLNRRAGNVEKMIKYYLIYAKRNASAVNYVKQVMQRYYSDSLEFELKNQLFTSIQNEPDEILYVDFLAWVYIQGKEYDKALRQVIALDRRTEDNGRQVYDLAIVAENDKDFPTAIKAYRYIVDSKSENNPYFLESRQRELSCMIKQLNETGALPQEELQKIRNGFNNALERLGKNNRTAEISLQYAIFEAYYMNNLDKAIEILTELINRTGLNEQIKARAKLELGDYYLISGEIWEGSLLFSQVDKTFQEGYLGELARFKNAKLSYYNGDFEWSRIQLDVLKRATSKLISNDAIDLSVFILENVGLDSTLTALQMYASAELNAVQHKYDKAFATLDSIPYLFPNHELEDDIWYLRARIYRDQRNFTGAEEYYKKVIDNHAENIRGDNAMYELAQLYENQLHKPEEARKLYEKIFIDFSNSTFAIEARKRYREMSAEEKFMHGIN
jgi:tetratricopeptide (TPR) repeat protein